MPTIAIVDGVKIQFFFGDHLPPHFHVAFAEFRAQIRLGDLAIMEGSLPAAKLASVRTWASQHVEELRQCWSRAFINENPGKVE
jgi:hypothetical protein